MPELRDEGRGANHHRGRSNGTLIAFLQRSLHPVVVRASALQTQDRMVPIQPQRVGWDRDGGVVSGEVFVVVTAELVWFDPEQHPTSTTSDGAVLVVAAADGPMPLSSAWFNYQP